MDELECSAKQSLLEEIRDFCSCPLGLGSIVFKTPLEY